MYKVEAINGGFSTKYHLVDMGAGKVLFDSQIDTHIYEVYATILNKLEAIEKGQKEAEERETRLIRMLHKVAERVGGN